MATARSSSTNTTAVEATVPLGLSDVQISPMGVGAFAWGTRMTWGYGGDYGREDVQQAFQESRQAGINWFDTAEVYGNGHSERLLGEFVREANDHVLVATKFAPLPWRLRQTSLLSALRASLQRLGVDHVDLYQIHFPLPLVSVETWMDAMAEAVEGGLTRAAGVSNYNAAQMRRAHAALAKHGIPLASNQVDYSLLHRDPERNGVMQACQELGVTLIAYTPLASGMLTGKYTPQTPPPGFRSRRYGRTRLERIQPLIGLMREIGAAHGDKTPPQVAINWTICKGAVPIPGAKTARHAQDNAGALGWRLSAGEVAALDAASDRIR